MHSRLLVFVLSFALTASASAQAPVRSDSSKLAAVAEMKSALRQLISAQEKYWSTHGTYTTEGRPLEIFPNERTKPMVQVIFAGSRGWTAMASHASLKGKSCVLWVGNERELAFAMPETRADRKKPVSEGAPMCDTP
jgi:hypothetical protein